MCNRCRLAGEGIYRHVSGLCTECFRIAVGTWLDLFSAAASLAHSSAVSVDRLTSNYYY